MVETIQHSDSENTDPDKRAIHIYGGIEHNLDGYDKYYSYGSIEISRGSEFTRKIDHNRRNISKHWYVDAKNKLYFELGTIA
jgi:hypothetical protein